ncbi:MAG: hypothetical protein ACYCPK_06385 [Acidimicrobiales bacterium]
MKFVVGAVKFWLTLIAIGLMALVVGKLAGALGAYVALGLLVIVEAAWVWRTIRPHPS